MKKNSTHRKRGPRHDPMSRAEENALLRSLRKQEKKSRGKPFYVVLDARDIAKW